MSQRDGVETTDFPSRVVEWAESAKRASELTLEAKVAQGEAYLRSRGTNDHSRKQDALLETRHLQLQAEEAKIQAEMQKLIVDYLLAQVQKGN